MKRASSTKTNAFQNLSKKQNTLKTELGHYDDFKRMSVVQERKYREFMARKKKLLGDISKGEEQPKRSRSPTS